MRMITTGFFSKIRYRLSACLVWLVMLLPVSAAGDQIEVLDFFFHQGEAKQQLVADIRFDYHLNDYLRDSLRNGITLRSEVRFDLIYHSEWWWNKTEQLDSIVSELKYNTLTGQYRLINKNNDKNWNFSNLAPALSHLGAVSSYALPDLPADAFDRDAAVYVEASLEPLAAKLPGVPEKLSSWFAKDENKLTSQGVMWPLTP